MMQCKKCGQDYELRIASFFPEIPVVLCNHCYQLLEKPEETATTPADHFICVDCGLVKHYID